MTTEEACECLGISLDDDLTVELLEKKYNAKLSENRDSPEKRAKIHEACEVLVDLFAESGSAYDEVPEAGISQKIAEKHEGLFMKLAVLMAGVFLLTFGGVMYFVYRLHTDSITAPNNDPVQNQDYDKLLRELDELRRQQAEAQKRQEESKQIMTQQNNIADYSELIE